MIPRTFHVFTWLLNLFNAPPRDSMTWMQKLGRVFLVSATLVIGSILAAMIGALGLFVMERGRELGSMPELANGVGIILVGVCVNVACVLVLLQIKRADHKLMGPPPE
jgi:uncharacterized membrane protein YidH (DUF202 family)